MSIPQTTFRYCCLYFDSLTGIYSWLFIDVLSLLPAEWSITVCKVNVQCPLTSPPPPTLLRILWQSYRYTDISWLFFDVLSFLPPIPEWSITFYKVNVQFPPQPHLELTITVYLDHYYVMFQTPLPTHPPLHSFQLQLYYFPFSCHSIDYWYGHGISGYRWHATSPSSCCNSNFRSL